MSHCLSFDKPTSWNTMYGSKTYKWNHHKKGYRKIGMQINPKPRVDTQMKITHTVQGRIRGTYRQARMGRITIFIDQLFAGLKLSFPSLVLEFFYKVRAPPRQFPTNFWRMFLSYYIIWKENGKDFTLAKFSSLYYLHFVSGRWFSLRPYGNHMFIDSFPSTTWVCIFHSSLWVVPMMLHVTSLVLCLLNLFLSCLCIYNLHFWGYFFSLFYFANSFFSLGHSTLEESQVSQWEAWLHQSVIFSIS